MNGSTKKNEHSQNPTQQGSDEGQDGLLLLDGDIENQPPRLSNSNNNNNHGEMKQIMVDMTPKQLQEEQSKITVPTAISRNSKNSNSNNNNKDKSNKDVNENGSHSSHRSRSSFSSSADSSLAAMRRLADASTHRVTAFILLLGLAVSGGFLGLGLSAAFEAQNEAFDRNAVDLVNKISTAWLEYVNAAGMIHGRCHKRDFSRADFKDFYQYLIGGGLSFQAAQFDPNITHDERDFYEAEARDYYAQYYPDFEYRGFIGFEYENSTSLEPRSEQDFYFPIHYMEPVVGNEKACGLDYHASGSRKRTVMYCMDNGLPALTDRLTLVQEEEAAAYGVVLMHPGYQLSNSTTQWPKDLASIVIRIPDLLRRATENQGNPSLVYIYDKSDSTVSDRFLGGVEIFPSNQGGVQAELEFKKEKEKADVEKAAHMYREIDVPAANKMWTVAVVAPAGSFKADYIFVLVGGIIILLATLGLALWVYRNTKRVARMNRVKAESDAEKANLILEGARKAAHAERELNDFIAHEVRNPVAAAMSACSFVKAELKKKNPLGNEETLTTTREDVSIIDNALKFVNDLLRNMLDMHRASNKKLKVNLTPTDLLHDVLEPVQSMLIQRGGKIEVVIDCEDGTFALADRLRLNQVMLNLGRNSAKFVDEGFIRLSAKPFKDGFIQVSVEDSGPGIPEKKKRMLFQKYQESLDVLSQGTGIGLFLCQSLVDLMDGQIYLDDEYDSGISGRPGSRFVVELKAPPKDFMDHHVIEKDHSGVGTNAGAFGAVSTDNYPEELPENLSILFVDDDPILRKLFARTIRKVCPNWTMREASNGETALQLIESGEKFSLIFMDMYMASVEKQLLGTETVAELRHRNIDSRICGLSANDKEAAFIEAGADVFCFKPFPCESGALRRELFRVLYSNSGEKEGGASRDI